MPTTTADIVVCGAGIAGIAAAYHLAVRHRAGRILLADPHPPLTVTSDKSTECYRNWWPGPGPAMVRLMNRSIDIMEALARESGNVFHLNRRGYLFATADPVRIDTFRRAAEEAASLGAGPLRQHTGQSGEPAYIPASPHGFESPLTGADLITDPALIRRHFPYLTPDTIGVLHVRRAGWFSAQQYGMYMLEQARQHGVELVSGQVSGVAVRGGRVQAVNIARRGQVETVTTNVLVVAAGPFLKQAGQLLDLDLPVFSELHIKVSFNDHLGVVPRHAPLLIWTDPVYLPWSEDERAFLAESEETRYMLEPFPPGVHTRPEGEGASTAILILWTYDTRPVEPTFPIQIDPDYPEIALRGLARMLPGLAAYFGKAPRPYVDGGYYTKTRENRPLIGPLPVDGAYVIGALSGFGLMASSAAGELLAAHVVGTDLPDYAPAFLLSRYEDPAYQALLENWGDSGQL
ncbi:MAG: FAD-binding oxidoreductase [Chloroflexi bacterium]|nr:MAG: FAD-binding oxidoreductase [Chloroflexota bacterium]